jgi:uncharacterized protein (TIGR02118 family)
MVKLMACLRRKPDMSEDAFHQYWKETHGPLVKSVTEFSRYVRRYIQSHTAQDVGSIFPPQATPPYDGIAELWFDSVEQMQAAFAEPRYLEIIRPDEQRFIDLPNCVSFIVDDVPMVEG